MKRHRFNSVEDFLDDKSFRSAVFEKDLTASEYWENWLKANPDCRENAGEARRLLLTIKGETPELSPEEIDQSINKVLDAVRTKKFSILNPDSLWLKIAASLVVIIGVGWGIVNISKNLTDKEIVKATKTLPPMEWVEVVNDQIESKLVRFPDGSSAMLSNNSSVKFSNAFNTSTREVYLSGEAFFEVTKNPTWPFVVHANEMLTQVVGTSFIITAYPEQKEFQVLVKTGKVKVSKEENKTGSVDQSQQVLTLEQNQKATFKREEGLFIDGMIEARDKSNAPALQKSFEFKRTPLPDVFESLEKAYNVQIIFDKRIASSCTLTASLGDEPLQEKLNMIVASVEASYSISGDKITVRLSKPCN